MHRTNQTDVFLITGFLGSGKTTFLNRVIKAFPADRKLMILMNEFGEIGIDGRLVDDQDLDMLEISKGSIFCVCVKTDFIKGLSRIANDLRPDVLLIEATGVANPADLRHDLKLSIFQDRFRFKEQFCIIDAKHFMDAYEVFTSVEKQLESSTVFVINKTDLATAADIDEIRTIVAMHHSDPRFFQTTFADVPLEDFMPTAPDSIAIADEPGEVLTDEQVEAAIDALLDNPAGSITPPDLLASSIYAWHGEAVKSFTEWVKDLPMELVRAKGFLRENDVTFLFNWVMGNWEIESVSPSTDCSDLCNRIVFIGHPDVLKQLSVKAAETSLLSHFSSFDPSAS